jgi:Ser/Thr protein kinase RdoA (MazF antagonist)
MVRLITWKHGNILEEAETGPVLLRQIGQTLARLGIALKDFSHPAANHKLLWDLKNAAELLELLPNIDEPVLRARLEKVLRRFERTVLPIAGDLRSQVIHADLNRGNILISAAKPEEITGIIDFGDMVHTPLIMDLAIAAAYHLSDSGDPLGNALHLVLGYHEVTPLESREAGILLDLMTARLCTSITLQMWRAKLYPGNSEYLLVHNRFSRDTLKHVTSSAPEESRRRIMQACSFAS